MPKELIFSRNEHGDPDTTRPVVRVSWSKEASYVEIATIHKNGKVLDVEPLEDNNGWFAQLDRKKINDLIRVLRRARDQAFGKDQ